MSVGEVYSLESLTVIQLHDKRIEAEIPFKSNRINFNQEHRSHVHNILINIFFSFGERRINRPVILSLILFHSLPPSLSLTHSLTHSLTLSHSLNHSLTQSLSLTLSLTFSNSLSHSANISIITITN